MNSVKAEGREILLARVGGKYYATDHRCSHKRGKLSQGKLGKTPSLRVISVIRMCYDYS